MKRGWVLEYSYVLQFSTAVVAMSPQKYRQERTKKKRGWRCVVPQAQGLAREVLWGWDCGGVTGKLHPIDSTKLCWRLSWTYTKWNMDMYHWTWYRRESWRMFENFSYFFLFFLYFYFSTRNYNVSSYFAMLKATMHSKGDWGCLEVLIFIRQRILHHIIHIC